MTLKDPEEKKAYIKTYYLRNKEHLKELSKSYRQLPHVKEREKARNQRSEVKERKKRYMKLYYQRSGVKERSKQNSQKRKEFIHQRLKEVYGDTCCLCHQFTTRPILHHNNGDGKHERELIGWYASWMKAINASKEEQKKYSILCPNCHSSYHGKELSNAYDKYLRKETPLEEWLP